MPAPLLTTSAQMMCPHGGTVTAVSTNTHTQAAAFVLRPSDTFIVAGCPFSLGPVYHPCVSVKWVVNDLHTKAAGDATLSTQSVGLCQAADQAVQGTVIVTPGQTKALGS
jgi:hypothetical protein